MAGMFIDGIAGIENTAFTVPSLSGDPSGRLTMTTMLLSPDRGGSGSLANVTIRSPALPVCPAADEPGLCAPPQDEASTANRTRAAGATFRTNHSGRLRRMSSPIAKRHGMRNNTYTVELIMPPKVGVAIG